jgi:hypothetical protein
MRTYGGVEVQAIRSVTPGLVPGRKRELSSISLHHAARRVVIIPTELSSVMKMI